MSNERVFIDTAFVLALLNSRDQYHNSARSLFPRVTAAAEVWVTEAVLTEVGNGLASINRLAAGEFIRNCYKSPNSRVVSVTSDLFARALTMYQKYTDKEWGMTDCISFTVMNDANLRLAVTADHHFVQAGFQILMT